MSGLTGAFERSLTVHIIGYVDWSIVDVILRARDFANLGTVRGERVEVAKMLARGKYGTTFSTTEII